MLKDSSFLKALKIEQYDAEAFAAAELPPSKSEPPHPAAAMQDPNEETILFALDDDGVAHLPLVSLRRIQSANHSLYEQGCAHRANAEQYRKAAENWVTRAGENAKQARAWRLAFWILFASVVVGVGGVLCLVG